MVQKERQNISQNTSYFCRNVDKFVVTGRNMEAIQSSSVHDMPLQPRVRYADISWMPNSADVGAHIVCITAVDDAG